LPTQPYFRCRSYRRARAILGAGVALFLSGCWTAPSASVRPPGKPRVITGGIRVVGVANSARVESVDRDARVLGLRVAGVPLFYGIGPRVRHWGDVRTGDEVSATLAEVLTVYVPSPREKGGSPDARVLIVDPSYRLLKLQYANGGTATFKVALDAPMSGIAAGDAVEIHPVKVIGLRLRRHSNTTSAR
jgi:hypothetical protein